MSYQPETLVLTPSLKCNLECAHCIVEAGPGKTESMDLDLATRALREARDSGIKYVNVYGGEPFLHSNNLLPAILRESFLNHLPVVVGSNGFWGRNEAYTAQVLSEMEAICAQYDNIMGICLSVDQYHQPQVPAEAIANIIIQYRDGYFPRLSLSVQTFSDRKSREILGDVYKSCHRKGVFLTEASGDYMYPALRNELIEFRRENYPLLANMCGLPEDATEQQILLALAMKVKFEKQHSKKPGVTNRRFDSDQGEKLYSIFPKAEYLIQLFVEERVINAGRARNGVKLEFNMGYENSQDLIIAPNGQAYVYPAQITAYEGIDVRNKSLSQVIDELRVNLEINERLARQGKLS